MRLRKSKLESCQIIIFGGTGDLTHRKLIPAFYNLLEDDLLPEEFTIVATGRCIDNREEYLKSLYNSLQKFVSREIKEEVWNSLKERIYYKCFDILEENGCKGLKELLDSLDNKYNIPNRRIFYLAVPPRFFGTIVTNLDRYKLLDFSGDSWSRVVIEKPFGYDLESACDLNKQITKVFPEENIYRIDHYLGKEMLQSMMVIRFANLLFEPLWNNKYIDNIQIISNEKVGVGDRGAYYEKSGALRDMVQNHMLQILSLTAMEPPANMTTESIRDEKIKVLKSLSKFDNVDEYVVRGQYEAGKVDKEEVIAYHDEKNVSSDSKTETYVALKTFVNNLRWSGVPFYIKTGKRLSTKLTEVIVEFKSDFHPAYQNKSTNLSPNLLVIKIQPEEGVYFQFNAKEPGSKEKIVPVKMDFCQNCQVGFNSPEAYERLMHSVIVGDQTLFTRWDEVEYSWDFVDQIADFWSENQKKLPKYPAGSNGPKEADDLLIKDGRKWWDI
ncbi:glucose-6-phosphate dehydrogenase [Orenia marismortui]|uniref:glucose-6-phosphate dehydrogenase n=1 Tax=Orenia marismortui TaxID=46469 RepID=UPI001B7FE2AB|nr:glucose-6-phosphate dehydrogenase [Orenia marismortui]